MRRNGASVRGFREPGATAGAGSIPEIGPSLIPGGIEALLEGVSVPGSRTKIAPFLLAT